jgi:transcriptional regulator with XRE-family HTH domain
LIEGRIARRFTQKQLGQKLGVPEQQIQRYEQTRYSGASIERLGEVAEALQLTIRKTIEYYIPSATGDQAPKSASKAAKRAAASDLSQVGNRKLTFRAQVPAGQAGFPFSEGFSRRSR